MEKIYHANTNQDNAEEVILILDKTDFIAKNFTRDKQSYFIVIKKSIYQEDITILDAYVPSNRALKYIKQKMAELKG